MAYQINKTDGTVVATVADGQIDTLSTDITLIGKNYSGFGEALNENFIKMLENFANTTRPTHPVRGQIWFDVSELKLKVYSGTQFLPVSSATISNTQPTSLGVGDLWFNDVDAQLYFFDGTVPILLGPAYSTSQGVSGLKVVSMFDTLNQTRVVTYLYTNGILLGIFSKDDFTPKTAIPGFTGNIIPGFNAGSLSGLKFNVTCTNSEQLGNAIATKYVRKDLPNTLAEPLYITADAGLTLGGSNQGNLYVNSNNVYLSNGASDKDLVINVKRGVTQEDAIKIVAATRSINLYNGFSTSQVNVGGSLTVEGNLTVNGTTTTVNSTTLTVDDKNIELASNASPSDITADGGGITLKGTTDHKLYWLTSGATAPEASGSWNSTENINLVTTPSNANPEIKINGVTILSSLLCNVPSFPNVNQLGTQLSITVGPYPGGTADPQLKLENNKISTVRSNLDIQLEPDGSGNVALIGSPKITGLADPTAQQDAATKEYVDDVLERRKIILSMDLSDGRPNTYIINNVLNVMAPPGADYRDGLYADILCTVISTSSTLLDINPLIAAGTSTSPFLTDVLGSTAQAVTNISVGPATVSASSISTIRFIKTFKIEVGVWTHQSDGPTF